MALDTWIFSFLFDKALLDAVLYLVFFFFLIVSVGSAYLATLSEGVGVMTRISDYDTCGYLYAKLSHLCSFLTLILLIGLVVSASVQLTALSSLFDPSVFGKPLTFLTGMLITEQLVMTAYVRTWKSPSEQETPFASLLCRLRVRSWDNSCLHAHPHLLGRTTIASGGLGCVEAGGSGLGWAAVIDGESSMVALDSENVLGGGPNSISHSLRCSRVELQKNRRQPSRASHEISGELVLQDWATLWSANQYHRVLERGNLPYSHTHNCPRPNGEYWWWLVFQSDQYCEPALASWRDRSDDHCRSRYRLLS